MNIISGRIDRIIYDNRENNYAIVLVTTQNGPITATGTYPQPRVGDEVEFVGDYTEHPKYGRQFAIKNYSIKKASSGSEIEALLKSGLIKGMGIQRGSDIYDHFGDESLEILKNDPVRLSEISGIGKITAQQMHNDFIKSEDRYLNLCSLMQFGLSAIMSQKIIDEYGSLASRVVKNDPYILIDDIDGIGFKRADAIAERANIDKADERRIRAAIFYLMAQDTNLGHCYSDPQQLVINAKSLLGIGNKPIDDVIEKMAGSFEIITDRRYGKNMLYLEKYYSFENQAAFSIAEIASNKSSISKALVEEILDDYQRFRGSIVLDADQKNAITGALTGSMASVITGGPGTGKTTIINAIIYTLTRLGLSYKLAAPTGRAAKRMSLACGEDASTIHRLLEVGFANGIMEYKRNSSNPLECDVVIIDEMSMVDLPLFWRLLNAMLPDEMRLIMVGDKDQLPSVSPGNVLNDIISTDVVTVSMLSNVFRQEEGTSIAPNAQRINRGLAPEAKAGDNSFEIVELSGQPEIADYIINYISQNESILQAMMQSEKVQIISPLKKGESGVISLNKKLQELINPEDVGKDEIEQFEYTLREGDKIMQTRNNYEASWENVITHETGEGVFNGDIGIIENINEYAGEITLLFDNEKRVKYTHAKDIEGITLAYAITIHKSQGSEFDYVIMPLFPTAPSFLTRNLLYTAVTRAKKKVAIIGEKRVIDHMVGNNQTSQRNSALRERIIELIRSPNFMSRR